MLKNIQGVYREGKIELTEVPSNVGEETPVIVTFLEVEGVDLRARGVDEIEAARLRVRLGTFAEEWESPEMTAYDDYETAKAKL